MRFTLRPLVLGLIACSAAADGLRFGPEPPCYRPHPEDFKEARAIEANQKAYNAMFEAQAGPKPKKPRPKKPKA